MTRFKLWIKSHQVLVFYLLTFAISWPAMIVAMFVFPANSGATAVFGIVAAFIPAVVAVMISAVGKPERSRAGRGARWILFAGAWVFSWLVLSLFMWQVRGMAPTPQIIIPSGVVALVPGWLISCAFSRISGIRELVGTIVRPRGHLLWYAVALFCVPAVQLAGFGITRLVGGDASIDLDGRTIFGFAVFVALTFLHGFLMAGGINEETGWRGFVLPRLQARLPVIGAVAVVWFFWALWHLPYDIGLHTPIQSILLNRILFNFFWAVLFAWVYNRTKGSLLAPAMFHPAMNTFGDTLPGTDAATAIFVVLVVAIIIRERMWKKLEADSPAVYS